MVIVHRGNKRKLEVSPLAEDRRRVSQRLNPEPDSTVPRTRAAASNASPAVCQMSTAGKGKQPSAKLLSVVPQSRNATRHHGNVTTATAASHTAGEAAKTRQAKPASRQRAAAATAGAHLSSPEAVTGAGRMAEATRQAAGREAAALKSRDASGKLLKGSTTRAIAQAKLVSDSGQGRSVPNSRQHKTGQATTASARQAADRIARSSTLRGKLHTGRPNVQLAVAQSAANASASCSRLTQNSAALASGTASVAAAKGTKAAAGTRAKPAALTAEASSTTTVSAASLKLLQEAAAAGKLGCPKCRYCTLLLVLVPFSVACLTSAVLAFRWVAALHSMAQNSSLPRVMQAECYLSHHQSTAQ